MATHPARTTASIGVTRYGVVYELFFTKLPSARSPPADVVDLYLHRGAFETALADEDKSRSRPLVFPYCLGQEVWQIISQWVWNLRLELGHNLHPNLMRTTEFAPALPSVQDQASGSSSPPTRVWASGSSPSLESWPFLRTRLSPQPTNCATRLERVAVE